MLDVRHVAGSAENPGAKERIFRAATSVALQHGFGKVTMNLVAREAGFSKGGLLYHFATKHDLIRAMLEHYADPAARQAGLLQGDKANSSPSSLDPFAVAVLIAAAENPAFLEPFGKIFHSVETGTDTNSEPESVPLIGTLAKWLGLAATIPNHQRKDLGTVAYAVRHKASITLLGLFVAQDMDALWDMVCEFCDPADYEYCKVAAGALVLPKNEMDIDFSRGIAASASAAFSVELSGSLLDATMTEGVWTAFHAAAEGSGIIAPTMDQQTPAEQSLPGTPGMSDHEGK